MAYPQPRNMEAACSGTLQGTETIIALENVYERGPEQIRRLLDALDSSHVRFCFDTGHANAFGSVPYGEWMEELGDLWVRSISTTTTARPMSTCRWGRGISPSGSSWRWFGEEPGPILTIESHSDVSLRRMLENIRAMKLLEGLS